MTDKILQKLDEGDIKGVYKLLEPLEKRRPLTRDAMHAKARILSADGKAQEAWDMLVTLTEGYYATFPDADTLRVQIEMGDKISYPLWGDYARSQLEILTGEKHLGRDEVLFVAQENALKRPKDPECLFRLADAFLKTQHHTAAMIVLTLASEYAGVNVLDTELHRAVTQRWVNFASVCELLAEKHPVVIDIDNNKDECCCYTLAELLAESDREVHLLQPSMLETSVYADMDLLTDITVQNIQHNENLSIYRPISIKTDDGKIVGNRPHVLKYILQKTGFALLFCEKECMDGYFMTDPLRRRGQRFSPNIYTGAKSAEAGYIGLYTTYISHIYKTDVTKMPLWGESKVGISVVIPTRDSADILEHTLKTCINQQITDYEILVSDNSSAGNTETRELVERLNCPKIRYIRTPRELPMVKNFEYAWLNARGEFIFTLGSDDGLSFNGLQLLERAIKELPAEDIIQWHSALFVTPDTRGSQRGQLVVKIHDCDEIEIVRNDSAEIMKKVISAPMSWTLMPLLYVNSGFRRRYARRLLNETGRLLDCRMPDVDTGMVNLVLNPTVAEVQAMVSISCWSAGSFSYRSGRGSKKIDNSIHEDYITRNTNIGHSIPNSIMEAIPSINTATVSPEAFMHVLSMGLNPSLSMNMILWADVYLQTALGENKSKIKHDLVMRQLAYGARKFGKEFAEWFEKEILPRAYEPMPEQDENDPMPEKDYSQGLSANGWFAVDSADYDVTNVHEAAVWHEKLVEGLKK